MFKGICTLLGYDTTIRGTPPTASPCGYEFPTVECYDLPMCSHYQGIKERERYARHFGVEPPVEPGKLDLWPGYLGSLIRRLPHADVGDAAVPATQALSAMFGLVPHWATDTKIVRHTYNARSETVAAKPSLREAWKRAQHCIIAADAIFEPDWRSGKPIPTRIERTDGEPMGLAGLWSWWKSPKGETVHSMAFMRPLPAELLQAMPATPTSTTQAP